MPESILADVLAAAGVSLRRSQDGAVTVEDDHAAGCGAVFCAWCGGYQGLKRDIPRGQVSHTICQSCHEKMEVAA